MKYSLDTTAAKEADNAGTGVQYIDQSGEYTGKFVLAKHITANTGTRGMEFTFQADDGKQARWLRLYTVKSDGSNTFGYGFLMALMTCLKIKEIDSEPITVEEWQNSAKVAVDIDNFTSLCDKPIGVLLQRENKDGTDKNGNQKFQMNIVGFFEPTTRKTATEILSKTEAISLDKKVAGLHDKTAKPVTEKGSGFADMKDDINDDGLPF